MASANADVVIIHLGSQVTLHLDATYPDNKPENRPNTLLHSRRPYSVLLPMGFTWP